MGERTQDVTIYDEDTDSAAGVTSDNRLQVIDDVQARVTESVQETEAANTDRNKVEYTVPVGKVLYVQTFLVSVAEGKMVLGFQVGGSSVWEVYLDETSTTAFQALAPDNNPFGPIPAGTEIRIRRVSGDSGKDWSAAYFGYLEDV